jgi:hypothetical protein
LLIGLLVLFGACGRKPETLDSLKNSFGKSEFIPSHGLGADGWAEARRRQLLKAYFKNRSLHYSETQLTPAAAAEPNKYRDVSLFLKGQGKSNRLAISFALKPGKSGAADAGFRESQQRCDQALFSFMATLDTHLEDVQSIEFLVTENCLDLTTQLRLQD